MSTAAPTRRLLLPTPRHAIRNALLALLLPLAGFIPFPTQMFPRIVIQIADPAGHDLPIPATAHWYAGNNLTTIEGDLPVSPTGQISLPARTVWASAYNRIYASSGVDHKLRPDSASICFPFPPDLALDAKASGITDLQDSLLSPMYAHGGHVRVNTDTAQRSHTIDISLDPGHTPATPLRIILRNPTRPCNPTLYPNPLNPHF